MPKTALDLLLERRSVVANKLGNPGPDAATLQKILTAAARVPDHKKLVPWRFIVFEGNGRVEFGEVLEKICKANEPDVSSVRLETEANRFLRVPVVVGVVSSLKDNPTVPEWEQVLSAGATCQNLLLAANAAGYSGQWITEWYAFDDEVSRALGLAKGERIAGFIYIGTAQETPSERDRPDLTEITTYWTSTQSD